MWSQDTPCVIHNLLFSHHSHTTHNLSCTLGRTHIGGMKAQVLRIWIMFSTLNQRTLWVVGKCNFGHRYSRTSFEALWSSDMLVFNSPHTQFVDVYMGFYTILDMPCPNICQYGIICQHNQFVWICDYLRLDIVRNEEVIYHVWASVPHVTLVKFQLILILKYILLHKIYSNIYIHVFKIPNILIHIFIFIRGS